MDITVSADKRLIEEARAYARNQGTTLNQLICDCLARLVTRLTPEEAARQFRRTAEEHPGHSGGWEFDRNAIQLYPE